MFTIKSNFLDTATMPKNYKKNRERTEELTMELTVELVVKDGFTLRKLSEKTGVPFQTLQRYVKKVRDNPGH